MTASRSAPSARASKWVTAASRVRVCSWRVRTSADLPSRAVTSFDFASESSPTIRPEFPLKQRPNSVNVAVNSREKALNKSSLLVRRRDRFFLFRGAPPFAATFLSFLVHLLIGPWNGNSREGNPSGCEREAGGLLPYMVIMSVYGNNVRIW